jgi:ribosomal protein L2
MALVKMKPTSPGTRFVVKIDKSHLWKGGPHEPLTVRQSKTVAATATVASPRATRAADRPTSTASST